MRYAYTNDFFKTSDVHWKEIPYENITLLNELGSGAFGVVYKGEIIREKGDVTPCAVKSLKGKIAMFTVFLQLNMTFSHNSARPSFISYLCGREM